MDVLLPLLTMPAAASAAIGGALGLAVLFVGALYVAAAVFQNAKASAMAKEELLALIFTGIIVGLWYSTGGISDILSNAATQTLAAASKFPGTDTSVSISENAALTQTHINLALVSLDSIIVQLKGKYVDLFLFESLIGFLSTVNFPLGGFSPLAKTVVTFTIAPFAGLGMLSSAHTVVVETISYLITVMWAKQFLLIFSRDVVPLLVLPLGLVLRAIPFTRHTGSSLVALSFAMYFVFPFAVLLSNYMIYDLYKPSDFTYNPIHATPFGKSQTIDEKEKQIEEATSHYNEIGKEFNNDVAGEVVDSECGGGILGSTFCSAVKITTSTIKKAGSFFSTILHIWSFTLGLTGDFVSLGFTDANPLMPASISAGLYYFIVYEVTNASQIITLLTLATIIELIITITMYANVSILLGGEAEIVGLSKIV